MGFIGESFSKLPIKQGFKLANLSFSAHFKDRLKPDNWIKFSFTLLNQPEFSSQTGPDAFRQACHYLPKDFVFRLSSQYRLR